jgi:4-carboxymuconolactone decarboxylase
MDHLEELRRLAVNDTELGARCCRGWGTGPPVLDTRTQALVRLAALVAVDGATPSYGALTDAALEAGATVDEIVGVLAGVVPVTGFPCVVRAAPKLALALGYDTDDEPAV